MAERRVQCMCEQPGVPCPLHGEVAWDEPIAQPRPAGPDPERDARIEVYRDRERRRAARALDRYIESLQSGEVAVSAVAGERVVELIGDYVLSRLQQKSHYGVPERIDIPGMDPITLTRIDPGPERMAMEGPTDEV